VKYFITILALIAILFTLPKDTPTYNPLRQDDTILAFGDSLTYGYGVTQDKSYPALLAKLTSHRVINGGMNGDTSLDGLKRLPKLLENNSIKLIILCFGGNDIFQHKPIKRLKANLKQMIHMAKAKKIDVLLISIPNVSLFGLSSLNIYKEIAQEEEVTIMENMLADIFNQPSLKSDKVHPNALGYKQMAKEIYKSLKENGWIE